MGTPSDLSIRWLIPVLLFKTPYHLSINQNNWYDMRAGGIRPTTNWEGGVLTARRDLGKGWWTGFTWMKFNAQNLFWKDWSPTLLVDLFQSAEQIIPWTWKSTSPEQEESCFLFPGLITSESRNLAVCFILPLMKNRVKQKITIADGLQP